MALVVPDSTEIGRRLKHVRNATLLSQEQLAWQAFGTGKLASLVSRLERGKFDAVDLRQLTAVANAAAGAGMLSGVTPEEILDFLGGRRDELTAQMSYLKQNSPKAS